MNRYAPSMFPLIILGGNQRFNACDEDKVTTSITRARLPGPRLEGSARTMLSPDRF